MAEGEGFEPPEPFPVQWFSRPPPSTTRPSLRIELSPAFARFPVGQHMDRPCVTGRVTVASTGQISCGAGKAPVIAARELL